MPYHKDILLRGRIVLTAVISRGALRVHRSYGMTVLAIPAADGTTHSRYTVPIPVGPGGSLEEEVTGLLVAVVGKRACPIIYETSCKHRVAVILIQAGLRKEDGVTVGPCDLTPLDSAPGGTGPAAESAQFIELLPRRRLPSLTVHHGCHIVLRGKLRQTVSMVVPGKRLVEIVFQVIVFPGHPVTPGIEAAR